MGTYLSRSQTNGNQDKWTWSGWVKRSTLSAAQCLFATSNGSSTSFDAKFDSSDRMDVYNYLGGGFGARLITNRVFRDVASWYHIVIVYDSGNGTEANRLRIYVNGTEESSFSTTNYPSQNENSDLNVSGSTLDIGRQQNGAEFFNGYLTDVNLIDGQALTPSTFGETDSTTGEWKPKVAFTGVTYGTNGFRCQFGNAAALGTDTSGNTNTLTVNNAGTNAKTVDTADNNFCTMNPLVTFEGSNSPNNIPDYSKGDTVATASNGTTRFAMATMATTMPYYFEVKVLSTSSTDTSQRVGVIDESAFGTPATYSSVYRGDGSITATGESNNTGNQTLSTNSIIGIAVDLATNYNIKYYHNGTLQATMAVGAAYRSLATSPFARLVDATQSFSFNFGNPSYTISSGNSDANGHGNFEYAVPSGYYALCTENLNTYG
tara:strand:+ start:74 stop:1372 length:1299 start_codon:yes stop_codon:yes gene_type:complete